MYAVQITKTFMPMMSVCKFSIDSTRILGSSGYFHKF